MLAADPGPPATVSPGRLRQRHPRAANITNTWTSPAANAGNVNGMPPSSASPTSRRHRGRHLQLRRRQGRHRHGQRRASAPTRSTTPPTAPRRSRSTWPPRTATGTGGFSNVQAFDRRQRRRRHAGRARTRRTPGTSPGPTPAPSAACTFSAFENLTGGTGDDTFKFNAGGGVTGTVDGGGGRQHAELLRLRRRDHGQPRHRRGDRPRAASPTSQSLAGSAAATNTLVGANTTNAWSITGANGGNGRTRSPSRGSPT